LAQVYDDEGKYALAEPLYIQVKVVEVERRVLGDEHPNTLNTTNNLAVNYGFQGK
jgi:non-specific serine/threonine protein kinase/serine/threonine-protein kinase